MKKITGTLKNYIVDAIKNSARKPLHINGFRALVSYVLLFPLKTKVLCSYLILPCTKRTAPARRK